MYWFSARNAVEKYLDKTPQQMHAKRRTMRGTWQRKKQSSERSVNIDTVDQNALLKISTLKNKNRIQTREKKKTKLFYASGIF
jgi:hypothetical protein